MGAAGGRPRQQGIVGMDFFQHLTQSYQELQQFVRDNPAALVGVTVFFVLALIGGWYVIAHHLREVVIAMFCLAGFGSGLVVLYYGLTIPLLNLEIAGAFLVVIFPLIYMEALRISNRVRGSSGAAISKGQASSAKH